MPDADFIKTDILIIGSGLAGLRCGISVLEENPEVSVLIVTKGSGPVGSSFTNPNNALGMQVCLIREEKERFVEDAVSIAPPGFIDPGLASIMAEESKECFRFLQSHHIEFNQDEKGKLLRYSGCFCPETKYAFIFRNLAQAFHKLKTKYISLSGKYIESHSLIHLINGIGEDETRVYGGVFISESTGRCSVINARSTILASGGTTPLFQWNVGGHSISGYSPAILKRAGAKIINSRFHQFTWHHSVTYQPVSPFEYLEKGASIRLGNKTIDKIPEKILSLMPERKTHIPAAYSFPDTAIEKFLLTLADKNGIVTFVLQNQKEIPAVLCAHAWNGGAEIDQNGWTGVPGLYACGECAGGMHGANRIGGAMVLATQVFGKRTGIHSARNFDNFHPASTKQCMDTAHSVINGLKNPDKISHYNILKQNMYKSGLNNLCGRKNIFLESLQKEIPDFIKTGDIISALLFESALIIS